MLVEAYNMQFFFMGVGQWRNEKALEKLLDSAGNKVEGGRGALKFFEMTESEIAKIAEEYRKKRQ